MTKREKIMVYIMILVVIAGIGILLIRPAYSAYNDALIESDNCMWEYESVVMALADSEDIQEQYDTQQERYQTNTQLGTYQSGSEMEKVILKQLESCGLLPSGTDVSETGTVAIPIEYEDTTAGAEEESTGEMDTDFESDSELEGQSVLPSVISFDEGQVCVTVTGTLNGLRKFLDLCKKEITYDVSSVSVADSVICDYAADDGREHTYYLVVRYYSMEPYAYLSKSPEEEPYE